MGTAPTGFDILAQAAPAAAQQQRAIHEQQRMEQQNTVGAQLLDSINNASNIKPTVKDPNGNDIPNPAYAQAQTDKQKLLAQYVQLNSPEQHASFGQRLHGLIFGTPSDGHQQPALSPNSSPVEPVPPPQPAAGGPSAAPVQPSAPAHPMAPLPADHPANKITEGLAALKNHLSAAAHPIPAPPPPDTALMAQYHVDPAQVQFERNKELWGVRGENAVKVAEIRKEALMASLQARPPRLLSQTTLPDLLDQIKVDPTMVIYGPGGQELSPAQLAEMPPGTIAREFRAGSQIFYALGDQNSKTLNVGGQIYQIPAVGEIAPGNVTPLGTTTSALPKEHQVPGMNPGEKVNLVTQPTSTPGMTAPPSGTPTAPDAEPTLLRRPTSPASAAPPPNPGARAPGTQPAGGAVKAKPSALNSPPPAFAPGTMLSQGRSAEPVVAAMSTVAGNVFGGNGETPIWDNAWMYDKPELRAALNKALTLNALATPGTEDNPSFMQTLATAVGATGWSQEQINKANVQARQDLQRLGGDAALKQFAREAALQEDLSALRTATRASAAQGSIRTLVRAAPVYNISSAQDFRNQLGTTLQTAASSMKGYPAISPKYLDWWDRGVSAAKGGPTSSNAPQIHKFAIDSAGQRRPVTDPNAKLPLGWKWAD